MTTSKTFLRRGAVSLLTAVVFVLLLAAPGSAHAELVRTDPTNGQTLAAPPTQITLEFSESVNLLDRGIALLKGEGTPVTTPDPTVAGHTVTWRMPAHLKDGAYVVSWRVISADGHPVEGAFAFGVGTAAPVIPNAVDTGDQASTAPWPVVAIRLVGYLAFSVIAGVLGFVLWSAPGKVGDPGLQRLTRGALGVGLGTAVLAMLLEGPYTAGRSFGRLFDPGLLSGTLGTPWGAAMAWRLALLLALAVMIWRLPTVASKPVRWLAPIATVAIAVTIAEAGHGAGTGNPFDTVVVTVHVLTAGIWVGGLAVLVVLGRRVDKDAVRRFSKLALAAVLVLVATGVLNSLRTVQSVDQLFLTRYGLLLLAKLALIAVTLVAASVSRTRVRQARLPETSVRLEAGMTAAVLTVTAILSMTSPPPKITLPSAAAAASADVDAKNGLTVMPLGGKGSAGMGIIPATTSGSRLHLLLTSTNGQPLQAKAVELKVSNPARNVAGIPVPMEERNGVWVARFTFPFPGTWKAVLTVHDQSSTAVVTAGTFTIS